jgi:exosortase
VANSQKGGAEPQPPSVGLLAIGLSAVLVWAYWPTLVEIAGHWVSDPMYSHGYLVPVFSAYLLWARRGRLKGKRLSPSNWGFAFLALGLALHLVGARFYLDWLSAASLIPSLLGLCLGLGGRKALKWAWPSIAFLAFMLPLPYRLEIALGGPLQRLATLASTYVLQTIGLPAVAEGNIIIMEQAKINVIEACSGLGMLVTFFSLATGLAILIKRPWPDKVLVVVSAVPIALAANVARITVTGLLADTIGQDAALDFFHDLAGLFMVPLALGLLWLELFLLSRLLIEPSPRPA